MTVKEIFQTPIFLAPMAGITDSAFRIIVKEIAGEKNLLMFSEMISAAGIYYDNEKTLAMLKTTDEEKPLAIQLFGSDPKICAYAAKYVEDLGVAAVIDFNIGCPVKKIIQNGEGSALMFKPQLFGEIISEMRKAVTIPLSVKMRLGYDNNHKYAARFSKIAEEAGVDFVAVHGRTREQFYSGVANWEEIAKVKDAVKIPVIANGDVRGYDSLDKILDVTKADGVMIGRAAQGNPWIIGNLLKYLRTGEKTPPPSLAERTDVMRRHFLKLVEFKGEYVATRQMRNHANYYTRGLKGGSTFRGDFNSAMTVEAVLKIIDELSHVE